MSAATFCANGRSDDGAGAGGSHAASKGDRCLGLNRHLHSWSITMKRCEMSALANSLCAYLCSRNNDIAGYWGIGILCASAIRKKRHRVSFKIFPGQPICIDRCEISDSKVITEKLVKFGLDSIEVRLSFFEDGRYHHGSAKYTCGIAIAITQGGRTGMYISHTACWPHDASRERQSTRNQDIKVSLLARLNNLLK